MIKIKIHSMVDVITNSSSVIYTYQNSDTAAKELIQEVLNLAGITDKTPDDLFLFGVFCDDDIYLESENLPDDYPEIDYDNTEYGSDERKAQTKIRDQWLDDIKTNIMSGKILKPEWMAETESRDEEWDPDTYLCIIVKDEKYANLATKIKSLLNSVDVDGGWDG
jgi:hypothetical protein